ILFLWCGFLGGRFVGRCPFLGLSLVLLLFGRRFFRWLFLLRRLLLLRARLLLACRGFLRSGLPVSRFFGRRLLGSGLLGSGLVGRGLVGRGFVVRSAVLPVVLLWRGLLLRSGLVLRVLV